jgi:hypothetical protein
LIDRLDGKAAQVIDQGQMTVTQLTDNQLYEIAARGLTETNLVPKALPAPRKPAALLNCVGAATVKYYFVVLLNSRASGDKKRGAAALPFRSQCVLRNRTFDR